MSTHRDCPKADAITIAAVTERDAADWLVLRDCLWPADDHAREIADYFAGRLEEPVEVFIARDADGHAVAHVELSIREDLAALLGVRTGYIEGLYVEPALRGSGLVGRLQRRSQQWARAMRCTAFASDRDDRVIIAARFAQRTGGRAAMSGSGQ